MIINCLRICLLIDGNAAVNCYYNSVLNLALIYKILSSKSDKLPIWERHFEPYLQLQKLPLRNILEINPTHKLLEDYLSIIPDLSVLKNLIMNK